MAQTLSQQYPHAAALIWPTLVASLVLLIVGIFAPLLTLEKLYIFTNTVSLFSGIQQLFEDRELMLGLIILVFSIVFPIIKLSILAVLWISPDSQSHRFGRWMNFLVVFGKWSMLDVFVVALILVSVKLGALASVEVHYGLYAFATSVLLSMLATMLTVKFAKQAQPD